MRIFRPVLPLAVCALTSVAWGEDNTTNTSVNCSFKSDPDHVLAASARARETVLSHLKRMGSGATGARKKDGNNDDIYIGGLSTGGTRRASEVPVKNFIDEAIFGRLVRENIPSAALSSDEEFYRRIHLDLTGRIPTAAKIREFAANPDPGKRDRIIDELLYSPAFTDRWVLWLGDLLGNASVNANFNLQAQGRNAFYRWMWENLDQSMSLKDIAWHTITAKGSNFDVGPANYMLRNSTPGGPIQDTYDTAAYRATRDFLGMGHYDCILCHNGRGHLEQVSVWGKSATRQEAQRMAAFFSRQRNTAVTTDRTDPAINARNVTDLVTGQYDLNTTFGNRPNRTPYATLRNLTPEYRLGQTPKSADWRGEFAEFLINDPMFAVNFANRIWKGMFNLALAEPVDQLDPLRLDPDHPPPAPWTFQTAHPQLLQALAADLRARDYNLREFLRVIVSSNAYQLSSQWEGVYRPDYLPLFARHYPRRLEGEEIHDAIVQATGMLPNYAVPGMDNVQWALKLPEPTLPGGSWMNNFFRGNRNTTDRMQSASIQQQLSLMNDTFITSRIKVNASPVIRSIAAKASAAEIVDEMWLNFLSRRPTEFEREKAVAVFARANTPALKNAAVEDLAWALINKIDFIFSY